MAGKPRLSVQPGDRFGRGVLLKEITYRDPRGKPARWAQLRCDCGTLYEARIGDLCHPIRPTRSCGCLARETAAERIKRAQEARWGVSRPEPVHGLSSHPLYGTWRTIRKQPGGLHALWHDVRVFVKEIEALIGPRPAGMAFRLIDPAGRYEPGNICWGRRGRPPRR